MEPSATLLRAPKGSGSNVMPAGAVQTAVLSPASPDTGKSFVVSPKCPHRLWGPARLIFSSYWGAVCPVVRLTTHLHLVPMLRISAALPPLPYTLSWQVGVTRYFLYIEMNF